MRETKDLDELSLKIFQNAQGIAAVMAECSEKEREYMINKLRSIGTRAEDFREGNTFMSANEAKNMWIFLDAHCDLLKRAGLNDQEANDYKFPKEK